MSNNDRKTLDTIYGRSSRYEKNGEEPLISFLKELAIRGCISQLDNILKSCYDGPMLPWLCKCDRGEEVFNLLPKDYLRRISSVIVSMETFYRYVGCSDE